MRESDKWELTAKGKLAGGRIKTSSKLGNYVEWPEDFNLEKLPQHSTPNTPVELLSTTKIAQNFGLTANKLSFILSELGWVDKSLKGWVATQHGLNQGAFQSEDSRTGIPYVKWPATLTESPILLRSIYAMSENQAVIKTAIQQTPGEYASVAGQWVNSEAEMQIANWLYMAEIAYAYKRILPIEEEVFSDFYISTGKVYIEYWDDNLDPISQAKKDKKNAMYKKYDLNLIELTGTNIPKLDDVLSRQLLKFGIQAY